MSNKNITISFPTLTVLFIVFLILKLTETITWSWWWVTAPLWFPFALLVAFFVIVFLVLFFIKKL